MQKSFLVLSLILALFSTVVYGADRDHDGVDDKIDKCPDTTQIKKVDESFRYAMVVSPERLNKGPQAWPVLSNGCEPDDDQDGVINSQDYCPEDEKEALSKGIAKNGCPLHSDQDGTPDYRDQCSGTLAGIPTNEQGCPIKGASQRSESVSSRLRKLII